MSPRGGTREGAGRPPIFRGETTNLVVRVERAMLVKLEALAVEVGVTLSTLVRAALGALIEEGASPGRAKRRTRAKKGGA